MEKKFSFKESREKHPILWNALYIILAMFGLVIVMSFFLDLWTHHGQTTRVPDVIGMRYANAVDLLEEADLKVVINDSVYSKDKIPGSVVDVVPGSNAVVKSGREVYLTIVAFAPEPITIDRMLTDISWKQAEAYLKSKGLRIEKRYVPSQFPDLVVDVKCKGRSLVVGSLVTADDVIVLEVGELEKPVDIPRDTLDMMIDAALSGELPGEPETEPSIEVSPSQQVVYVFGEAY